MVSPINPMVTQPPVKLNTSQPTSSLLRPTVANFGHFENAAGITTQDARWSDAPFANSFVVGRNTVTGAVNMQANIWSMAWGRGWLWE